AHDPPGRGLAVSLRLAGEEGPRLRVRLELALLCLIEPCFTSLLVRIDAAPWFFPKRERSQACGPHSPLLRQLLHPGDVDRAPVAPWPPWREPLRIAVRVDAAPDPVNPAETQRFVDRL